MQKAKIKYHQPSVEQLQSQKMDQIFEMLKKQQEGMSSLLKKYQSYDDQQDLNQVFSQKHRHSKHKQNKQENTIKSRSLAKSRSKSNMLLPDILKNQQNQRLAVLLDRRKKKSSHTIQPVKTSLRKQLQVIYKDRKKMRQLKQKSQRHNNNRSLSKHKSVEKTRLASQYSTIIDGIEQRIVTNNTSINSNNIKKNYSATIDSSPHYATQQHTRNSQQIPQPLGMTSLMMLHQSSPQSQSSDSQQEEIPFAYYEREFKSKMTTQCIQQINYLYFSKNESIKDWSQSLLTMFQRHDKEIVSLRKKMKYLQKFDDKFFAADIYKNQ